MELLIRILPKKAPTEPLPASKHSKVVDASPDSSSSQEIHIQVCNFLHSLESDRHNRVSRIEAWRRRVEFIEHAIL